MKKVFKVKLIGLNQFGFDEIKKYYKPNIERYGERAILTGINVGVNPFSFRTKTMKQEPNNETYIGSYDCCLYVPDLIGYGPKFSLQLKHFDYEVETFELVKVD